MSLFSSVPLRAAALAIGVAIGGFAGVAQAADTPYRFEVLEPRLQPSRQAAELHVRLVRAADGQPVSGAALQVDELGMWPTPRFKAATTWMSHAAGPVTPGADGTYRLPAALTMSGTYRLSLAATVPGEPAPVHGTVVIRAQPQG